MDNPTKAISFYDLKPPSPCWSMVTLGYDPTIRTSTEKQNESGWRLSFHKNCLKSTLPSDSTAPEPNPPENAGGFGSGFQTVYHDLAEVFRKDLTLSLPPHLSVT